jgi:hypothetical protein
MTIFFFKKKEKKITRTPKSKFCREIHFGDRCYDLKKILSPIFGKKLALFAQTAGSYCKKIFITLFLEIVLFERRCHAIEKSEAIACARRCQSSQLARWWTQKRIIGKNGSSRRRIGTRGR